MAELHIDADWIFLGFVLFAVVAFAIICIVMR